MQTPPPKPPKKEGLFLPGLKRPGLPSPPRVKENIPYLNYQDSLTKQGITASIRVEKIMRVTMPGGYDARRKYQVITSHASATENDLTDEQERRGRLMQEQLREALEEAMNHAGWTRFCGVNGQPLMARNGFFIWEYQPGASRVTEAPTLPRQRLAQAHASSSSPAPVQMEQEAETDLETKMVSRRIKAHELTFRCAICGTVVTELHYPGQKPRYCQKNACQREAVRLRVAQSRKNKKAKQQSNGS